MLTDTHTHLFVEEFDGDRTQVMKKALSMGIARFFLPNIDSATIDRMLQMETDYPSQCLPMMGVHPCHVNENAEQELSIVRSWLEKRRFAGIGEIGLDLYWDKTHFQKQQDAFERQMKWAVEFNYGVTIHCRSAFDELYEQLNSMKERPRSVFHCFSGTTEQAEKILALGNFKLGIGGVVTFKNAGLDKVVEAIGLEHLVLETDAPYLAPVPFRGKRNEPSYLMEVARKVAQLKNVSLDEVAEITSANADTVFFPDMIERTDV